MSFGNGESSHFRWVNTLFRRGPFQRVLVPCRAECDNPFRNLSLSLHCETVPVSFSPWWFNTFLRRGTPPFKRFLVSCRAEVTAHTEGDMGFPGDDRTICRGSVRVPKGGERGRDTGSLGGKGECVPDNVTIVELTVLRVWYPSWVPDTLLNKRQVSDLPSAAAPGVRSNIIHRYTLSLAPKARDSVAVGDMRRLG
jgi:hypothetical protein